jgi:hypothetical protein
MYIYISRQSRNGTLIHSDKEIFYSNDQTKMVTGTVFKTLVLSRFLFLFLFHFFFVGFVTSNMETHNINPCRRGGNLETNIKCFFISCDVDVINLATKKKKKKINVIK